MPPPRSKFLLKNNGFTLAEVLITLGIIGVVAALTIPTLIAKYQLKEGITAYKHELAVLNHAATKIVTDFGYVPDCYKWLPNERPYPSMNTCIKNNSNGECIAWGDSNNNPRPSDYSGKSTECKAYQTALEKNLEIIKKCNFAYYDNCTVAYKGKDTLYKKQYPNKSDNDILIATAGWSALRENRLKAAPAAVLSNGSVILYYTYPLEILIDVNGKRGPNKWGYDLFWVQLKGSPQKGLFYMPLDSIVENGGVTATQALLK